MAQRVVRGNGAKRYKNLGDGAVPQDPTPGLQIHQSEQFPALRQRRKATDGRGDAGGRQLQRAAPERAAGGAAVLQSGRRDVRVVARAVPDGVPPRVRVGGHAGVRRPADGGVQVPALGIHGRAV